MDSDDEKTIIIKRSKSVTLDLKEYHDIVDLGHRLSRFTKLVYDNREGLTKDMIEHLGERQKAGTLYR